MIDILLQVGQYFWSKKETLQRPYYYRLHWSIPKFTTVSGIEVGSVHDVFILIRKTCVETNWRLQFWDILPGNFNRETYLELLQEQ